ncbi:1051_t:CDS:2 [Gigaspora rosea]|nr:1051_t:CDS:2 [Gigaspora rosea]
MGKTFLKLQEIFLIHKRLIRIYPIFCGFYVLTSIAILCAIKYFVSNYERWTSGDQIVDQVIKHTQENSKSPVDFVEWIPYEQLEKRETIGQDKYGNAYSAFLKNGPILMYNSKFKKAKGIQIALRRLKNNNFNESLRGLYKSLKCYTGTNFYISNNVHQTGISPIIRFYDYKDFKECEITSLSQNIQDITQEIELVIKRNTAPKPPPSSKVVEHSSGKDSSYTTIGQIQT